MAAPSVAVTSNGVNSSSVTVTLGGAPASGVGLLFIASSDTSSAIPAYTPGSGMDPNGDLEVVIAKQNVTVGSATVSYQVWARVAGASEASSFTLDMDISRPCALAVHVITPDGGGSYADVADFLDVFDIDIDTAWEPVCPSVTTTGDDRFVEYSTTWDEGKSLTSIPSGTSSLYTVDISGHDQHGASKTQSTAGATGSASWNISSTTRAVAATFAYKNPDGGGAPDPSEFAISGGATAAFKSATSFSIAGGATAAFKSASSFVINGAAVATFDAYSPNPAFNITGAATTAFKSASVFNIAASAVTDFDPVVPLPAFSITGGATADFTAVQQSRFTIIGEASASFESIAQSPTPGDIAALDALNSAEIGIFINNGETFAQAMDEVAQSIGAYYHFDSLAYFRMGRIDPPSGSPVMYITKPDISVDIDRRAARDTPVPIWSVSINYKKNYTRQTSLAGSVDTARRNFLDKEYRTATDEDASIKTQFLLADKLEVNTLLINESDALTEAARLLAIHSVPRSFFEFSVAARLTNEADLQLADCINITYDRFDLDAGGLVRVTGIRRELGRNRVRLTVWA